jgi:hypothetical protein
MKVERYIDGGVEMKIRMETEKWRDTEEVTWIEIKKRDRAIER